MKASLTKSMLLVCISNQNVTLFGTKVRILSESAKDNMHKNEAAIETLSRGAKKSPPEDRPESTGNSRLGPREGRRPSSGGHFSAMPDNTKKVPLTGDFLY